MEIAIALILIVIAAIAAAGLRVAAETERFVVTILGQFARLAGPGLVYSLPVAGQRWTKIRIGDIGTYRGEGIGEFRGVAVPVSESAAQTNDAIQITSFRDGNVWVSQAAERIVVCEKCGHENRVGA